MSDDTGLTRQCVPARRSCHWMTSSARPTSVYWNVNNTSAKIPISTFHTSTGMTIASSTKSFSIPLTCGQMYYSAIHIKYQYQSRTSDCGSTILVRPLTIPTVHGRGPWMRCPRICVVVQTICKKIVKSVGSQRSYSMLLSTTPTGCIVPFDVASTSLKVGFASL